MSGTASGPFPLMPDSKGDREGDNFVTELVSLVGNLLGYYRCTDGLEGSICLVLKLIEVDPRCRRCGSSYTGPFQ
jgi:hypothetical protein